MNRVVFLLTTVLACVTSLADVRPLPPIVALCDPASTAAAQWGRDRLLSGAHLQPETILCVSGGAIASTAGTSADRAARAAALLDAAGIDVANLASRDLCGDAAALASAIASSKTKFVSASFKMPAGTNTPWSDIAFIERGTGKFAVIGLAAPSGSDADNSPIPGLVYTTPKDALSQVLPKVGDVSGVIILADLPLADLRGLLDGHPAIDVVIVSARAGGSLSIPGSPQIFRAPAGGGMLGLITSLSSSRAASPIALTDPKMPSDQFSQIAAKFNVVPRPIPDAPIEQVPAAASTISSLSPDHISALSASSANRGVKLTVKSVGLLSHFGSNPAPDGTKFLVVDATFENILTPQLVRDQKVPVEYQVAQLYDNLYVTADATVLHRHDGDSFPDEFPADKLELPRMGAAASGKLVLSVPTSFNPAELTVRFYDFTHGHIVIPVIASKNPEPIPPSQKNQVLESAVFGLKKSPDFAGQKALVGMTYVQVDFRSKSLLTYQADATAFNPRAKPGDKMKIGTAADWKESRQYIQLVADGQYAYSPLDSSTLAPEPRFLPDVFTGGSLIFLAPQNATSLSLHCDFPNVALNGQVQEIHPEGFDFALEGNPPATAAPKPLAQAKDSAFEVSVLNEIVSSKIGDVTADDGLKFVTLQISVKNVSSKGEIFQTNDQLKYALESGTQVSPDDASYASPHRPWDMLWIPRGQTRAFDVVYRIADSENAPRLVYGSVDEGGAKVFKLPPLPRKDAADQHGQTLPPHPPIYADDVPARKLIPKGLEGVGLTADEVNKAVDSGAKFLWNFVKEKDLGEKGETLGAEEVHMLCLLALVHSDAIHKFPDFEPALKKFLAGVDIGELRKNQPGYTVGLLSMLIESYSDPHYYNKLRLATRYLLEAQGPQGFFNYGTDLPDEIFSDPAGHSALRVTGGLPPAGIDEKTPPWKRLTKPDPGSDGDNSVSQFAILGLHSASRLGIKLPPETWKPLVDNIPTRQNDDGGWCYNADHGSSYGSMTCAGICSLAIARFELGDKNFADDPAIHKGLDWLNQNFAVDQNPHSEDFRFYYLYSIERVGRILDTEFIGDNEWYPLGAKYLIGSQHDDGSWIGPQHEDDPRLATSFALLFLTRATPRLMRESHPDQPGKLETASEAPPGMRLYFIEDCSGSMLDEIDGKKKMDIARDCVQHLIDLLPDNSQVALRVYGNTRSALDPDCDLDTTLAVPMGPLDRAAFHDQLQALRARGKTPMALSLEQAKSDIGDITDPITIVLLTDGGEDTRPRKDPVKAAADLIGDSKNLTFQIVGFDIGDNDEWGKQLQDMAKAAKGTCIPVAKEKELSEALQSAVFKTPTSFTIADGSGSQISQGKFGDTFTLKQGHYTLKTTYANKPFSQDFWINGGETTAVTFDPSQITQ